MTRLANRLKALIQASGPTPVSDFMAQCLLDPQDGYYTTREPFGARGDFVTAPEISQIFGELIGAWIFAVSNDIGSPTMRLIELGPGRGTLMRDVLRTLARLDPNLRRWQGSLVEASPRLTALQREALASAPIQLDWHATLETVPPGPAVIIGNEIFDALPIRQFEKRDSEWRERLVGLDESGELTFVLGPGRIERSLLPADADRQPDGSIFEVAPARQALMVSIVDRLRNAGGAALFFDYGHLEPGFGDTLQAVRRHNTEDVFAAPGEADLTSHVDFAALSEIARYAGFQARMTTQGEFLLSVGILERAGRLGHGRPPAEQEAISQAVERLAAPDQMGSLFKVLAFAPPGASLPGFV